MFGVLAQYPFAVLAGGGFIGGTCVNILFVFLIAWLIRELYRKGPVGAIAGAFLFVVGSLAATSASFSWAGLASILALAAWFRSGKTVFGIVAALCLQALAPTTVWIVPATIVLSVLIAAMGKASGLKRFLPGNALVAAYAGHLWLVALPLMGSIG